MDELLINDGYIAWYSRIVIFGFFYDNGAFGLITGVKDSEKSNEEKYFEAHIVFGPSIH